MKISILMPVFNAAGFLPECLESILRQKETCWELLAVNDFSTDESFEILQDYAGQDDRIRVMQNREKGIAPALKLAFESGTGELVTRMDSDDIMEPGKLATLKRNLLNAGRNHVATGCVEYFASQGPGDGYLKYAEWLNELTRQSRNFAEIYKECVIPSPCWMAFRTDLEQCRAFQDPVYPEDYDLCFRMRQSAFSVIGSPEILHRWRDHPGRTSRNHEHYRDNAFLDLKINWFLRSDFDPGRPLTLWGTGKKGKRLARMLNARKISFGWITNNDEKTGRDIHQVQVRPFQIIEKLKEPQIIIAVAAPQDQHEIRCYLQDLGLKPGNHFFFFC